MILVTGACGFIGRHLIQTLKARTPDMRIRGFDLVQPEPGILPDDVSVFCGSLEQTNLLSRAVRDADAVVHLAAKVEPDSRELQHMRQVNVVGAQNVYAAAVASGCRLFVHMSSSGVYGPPRSGGPFRETDPHKPTTPYQVTKSEAEQALCQMEPKHTQLNILRPTGIHGAGRLAQIGAYRKVLTRKWSVELAGDVIIHPAHVRDVVEAIIAILGRPAPHQTAFNVGGERPIRLQEFYALVAEMFGVRRRRVVLPRSVAGPLADLTAPICSLMGRPKPLLAEMSRGYVFTGAVDDSRFRKGYPGVPVVTLADGVREHIEWARARGLI